MRVIAGTCRSIPLAAVPGSSTRPTTDRIKETLFNVLMPWIPGCRFLDLFAGSGAIGIEALSRGAACACFIEQSRAACNVIRANLEKTRLTDRAEVRQTTALAAVRHLMTQPPYDIIFLDPPYGCELEQEVLPELLRAGCASEGAQIVLETAIGYDTGWILEQGITIRKTKIYKTNQHIFLEPKNGDIP